MKDSFHPKRCRCPRKEQEEARAAATPERRLLPCRRHDPGRSRRRGGERGAGVTPMALVCASTGAGTSAAVARVSGASSARLGKEKAGLQLWFADLPHASTSNSGATPGDTDKGGGTGASPAVFAHVSTTPERQPDTKNPSYGAPLSPTRARAAQPKKSPTRGMAWTRPPPPLPTQARSRHVPMRRSSGISLGAPLPPA